MFGRNKKRRLAEENARAEFLSALYKKMEKFEDGYRDAVREPDAAKRFIKLNKFNKKIKSFLKRQTKDKKKILQDELAKGKAKMLGAYVTVAMPWFAVTILPTLGVDIDLPTVAELPIKIVGMGSAAAYYFTSVGDYSWGHKQRGERMVRAYKEDVEMFLGAVHDMKRGIEKKIKFDKENSYQDILKSPSYERFEKKFPKLDKEFAKRALKDLTTEKKQLQKPTYTMPKNGMTPPKPKGI